MKKFFNFLSIFTLVFIIAINLSVFAEEPGPCTENTLLDCKLETIPCGTMMMGLKDECVPFNDYWYCCTEDVTVCEIRIL